MSTQRHSGGGRHDQLRVPEVTFGIDTTWFGHGVLLGLVVRTDDEGKMGEIMDLSTHRNSGVIHTVIMRIYSCDWFWSQP